MNAKMILIVLNCIMQQYNKIKKHTVNTMKINKLLKLPVCTVSGRFGGLLAGGFSLREDIDFVGDLAWYVLCHCE